MWFSFRTADGGDVLVDDRGALNSSTRYSSFQNFGNPRRAVWTANNGLLSDVAMGAAGYSGGALFRTPLALNRVNAGRMVAGSASQVNESFNSGSNFNELPLVIGNTFVPMQINSMDYGGKINGAPNADILWVGGITSTTAGLASNVVVRPTLQSGLLLTNYPGKGTAAAQSKPVDLEMDPADGRICYVADQFGVIRRTTDLGVTWQVISTTLGNIGNLLQIEFVTTHTSRYLFVCSDAGVFYTDIDSIDVDPALATWRELGSNLPNAPVWDIEFDSADDIIVVGTLGRGAWTYSGVSDVLDPIFPRATVFVDQKYNGTEYGTRGAPFRTVEAAMEHVVQDGTIQFLPGNHALSFLRIRDEAILTATTDGPAVIR